MSTLTTSPRPASVAARRGDDSAGRAGADRADRTASDRIGCGDATGGRRDEELALVPVVAQALLEPAEVAHDRRSDVGVHERRRRALELGRLRVHLVRERDQLDVGVLLEDELAGPELVRGVQVGVEEHHRDRGDAERLEPPGGASAPPPRRAGCRCRLRRSCARGSRGGRVGARSARAPGTPGPRCPPCSNAAARSRRGSPR